MADLDNAPDAVAQALIEAGMHCVHRGDPRAARFWFAQAEQADDPHILVRLAAIYERTMRDRDHAEACYRRAINHGSLTGETKRVAAQRIRDSLAPPWLRRRCRSVGFLV